ncbi:hypothetical protein V5O48_002408 [Marasmius crinis-equi]|uniref:AB hydrolase-1 domain-containing protein n=1 Tax=Marasmius crinis-equi TaxID=585013 RepID=A0ABR3FWE0_9AGAR
MAQEPETYYIKEGFKVIERFFEVPLDHNNSSGEKIRVFARNIVPRAKAKTQEDEERLSYVVFLQGGPGFEVPLLSNSGICSELHDRGYQTLWLDQRGTGLSTPFSIETLPSHVKTDQQIADYLKFFRADSIVKDCEVIRKALLGSRPEEEQKWSLFGQSFGGFCSITYLSFFPEGLKEVFLTGGLAPLIDHPDPNYEATAKTVIARNHKYYEKYLRDVQRVCFSNFAPSSFCGTENGIGTRKVRDIVAYLESNDVQLPNGGHLSVNRWQGLGIDFGAAEIVLRAANDLELFGKLSYKVLQTIQNSQSLDGNPIYAILHEPIYCQGKASNWAAKRVTQKYSHFSWQHVKSLQNDAPLWFTGEMIFPENFDDYANLRPLKGAAELLAQDSSWGQLYDLDQLSKNTVPVTTATYYDDMQVPSLVLATYVPFELCQETVARIKNTEQYITNQLQHGGIREDPRDVMRRLFQISKREFD